MSSIELLYYDSGFLTSLYKTWENVFNEILERNGNEMDLETLMKETDNVFVNRLKP